MNKFLSHLLILLILTSCSWSLLDFKEDLKADLEGETGEKLITDFAFEDDIQAKFSTKGTVEKIKNDNKNKKLTNKLIKPKKTVSKSKANGIIESAKTKLKKNDKPEEVKKSKHANGLIYPADFPDELIKIDSENLKFHKSMKMIAPVNEKTFIDISYMGITVGKIILSAKKDNEIAGRPVHHLFAKLVSAPFYKYIYKLDDVVESFVDKESLLPVKYSLVQRESGQSIDDLQLFDRDKKMTYFREKRIKKGKTRYQKKDVPIPHYAQDGLSSLFYLKSIPGIVGNTYNFPLVTKGRVTIMTVHVQKREKIETEMGEFNAILFKMKTRYSGDVVKKGDLKFWLTDDARRIVLKFEASTNMGRVKGETVAFESK
jgi:hypothetical protein